MYVNFCGEDNVFCIYPIMGNPTDYLEYDVLSECYRYKDKDFDLYHVLDEDMSLPPDLARYILGDEEYQKCKVDPSYLSDENDWVNNPFRGDEHYLDSLLLHFNMSKKTKTSNKEVKVASISKYKSLV